MSADPKRAGGGDDRERPVRLQTVPRSPFWWYLSKWMVLVFSRIWFRLRKEGVHNLPAEGPVLLVANHSSYLDPPMVGVTAKREVNFLAQAGLASFAPMRWWLAQVGVTLIDRDAPSKAAMRLIADCLKKGEVVGIFPEGTRSKDGRVRPFKSGVEFLIRRTGATVLPIGIDGSFRAYPRGAWFPRPTKIVVRFGEPWTAEQVLADGGIEALRRRVAELARCELTGGDRTGEERTDGDRTDGDRTDEDRAGGAESGKGPTASAVDPSSSTSASAGGGA